MCPCIAATGSGSCPAAAAATAPPPESPSALPLWWTRTCGKATSRQRGGRALWPDRSARRGGVAKRAIGASERFFDLLFSGTLQADIGPILRDVKRRRLDGLKPGEPRPDAPLGKSGPAPPGDERGQSVDDEPNGVLGALSTDNAETERVGLPGRRASGHARTPLLPELPDRIGRGERAGTHRGMDGAHDRQRRFVDNLPPRPAQAIAQRIANDTSRSILGRERGRPEDGRQHPQAAVGARALQER